jgi:asparagine synthetase B (glutamine-hydrolysing)
MRPPHPITVTLSGGLDSRSIVGAVDEKDRDKVKTFTYIFKGQDKTSKIAKKIAKTCNVQNVQGTLTPEVFLKNVGMGIALTDGMRSMSSFHLVSLVDKKELWSDVVLFATLMDAIFGGSYLEGYLKKEHFKMKEDASFIKLFYDNVHLELNELIDMKLKGRVFNSLKGDMEMYIKKSDSHASAALYFNAQNRGRRFIFPALSTLRWRMEVRNPSYDYDFMDFTLSIPRDLLCDRQIQIEFLKKLNPDLVKIPDNNVKMRTDAPQFLKKVSKMMFSYGHGLRKILERRAKGRISLPFFRRDTPEYDDWFFGLSRFNDFVIDVLSDVKSLRELAHFNEEYVKELLEEQLRYEKNNAEILFRIATFELWYRSFVEDRITHDKNAQRW